MQQAFGLDFGTSSFALAHFHEGRPMPLLLEKRFRVASLVYIAPEAETKIFGRAAEKYLHTSPAQMLYDIKPSLGGTVTKTINGIHFSASDAARELLAAIRRKAEIKLKERVANVVVTLPSCFSENQRRDMQKAVSEAGLVLHDIIPDAQAAAIAFAFDCQAQSRLLVLDIGTATFDVALVEIAPGSVQIKASGGGWIGGLEFNRLIAGYFNDTLAEKEADDQSKKVPEHFPQILLRWAEEAKIALATQPSVFVTENHAGEKWEIEAFTREQMAVLIHPHLEIIGEKIRQVLKNGNHSIESVDDFLLLGGSCKHPVVHDWLEKNFKKPVFDVDPDTCVTRGAAIHCHRLLCGEVNAAMPQVPAASLISRSIGVEMFVEKLLRTQLVHVLKRNTRYPARGVVFGSTQAGQGRLRFKVFQGEDIDTIPKNKFLGELTLDIQQQNTAASNGLAVIFHLNEHRKLTFTAVEMPYSKELMEDILFQRIVEFADRHESVIPFADLDALMRKYDFHQQESVIFI